MVSCLVRLTDKGFCTGMILVDLQKAFDMLHHNILLFYKKWNALVLMSHSLNAFNHIFHTERLENVFSDAGVINCGVPQRSILGLLLFLIYDLSKLLNKIGSYLCADDTCIFINIRMLKKQKKK